MTPFTISANPPFLLRDIKAFYHANFYGANHPENPNFLYKLKNDVHHNWTDFQLQSACTEFKNILLTDLPLIKQNLQYNSITVCVVPRAKSDVSYNSNQMYFRSTIQGLISELNLGQRSAGINAQINRFLSPTIQNIITRTTNGFDDGTNYIIRHTNTKTTHLRQPIDGFINDGSLPYAGITLNTCTISNSVVGKNILLIDDIYTRTVNIDEDVIQALLTKGANSVAFYAIGNTVSRF